MAGKYDSLIDEVTSTAPAPQATPQAPADKYGALIDDVTSAAPLHSSLFEAMDANPQEEVRKRKLARELNTPAAVLPADAERRALFQQTDAEQIQQKSPATAKFLTNPDNAKVTGLEGVKSLTNIESVAKSYSPDNIKQFIRNYTATGKTAAEASQKLGEMKAQGIDLADYNDPYRRKWGDVLPDLGKQIVAGTDTMFAGLSELSRPLSRLTQALGLTLGATSEVLAKGSGQPFFDLTKQTQENLDETQRTLNETAKYWQDQRSTGMKRLNEELTKASALDSVGLLVKHPALLADQLAQSLPYLLPGVASARWGEAAVLVSNSLVEASDAANSAREEAIQAGATKEQQDRAATSAALIAAPLVFLGNKLLGTGALEARFFTKGTTGHNLLQTAVREFITGGIEEGANQLGVNVGAASYDESRQLLEGVGKAALLGGVLESTHGISMSAAGRALQAFMDDVDLAATAANNRQDMAAEAEAIQATMTGMSAVAAQDQLRANDPESFKAFAEMMTDESDLKEVYVDGQTALNALGTDQEVLRQSAPELVQAIEDAALLGTDVAISVPDYLTHLSGSNAEAAILPELKADPNGSTYSQAQEFYQTQSDLFNTEVKAVEAANEPVLSKPQFEATGEIGTYEEYLANHANKREAYAKDVDQVRNQIVGQFNTAGRFTAPVNRSYTEPLVEFYKVQAKRMGMSPTELYAKYPLKVQSLVNFNPATDMTERMNAPQTETPEFKKWFGDSKVVDADGKPLVVYHGGRSGIEMFNNPDGRYKTGIFFTADVRVANLFAGKGETYPVYLTIKKPFIVDAKNVSYYWIDTPKEMVGYVTEDMDTVDTDLIAEWAFKNNYDGVIIKNVVEGRGEVPSDVYIVPKNTQIKSAVGNRGTFDLNDPNILNQLTNATIDDLRPENVKNILDKGNWSIMSPENPMGEATPERNPELRATFEKRLQEMGITYVQTEGKYGNPEVSYVLFGISPEEALALGREFNQDSVLTRDGLIYQNGTRTPTTGKVNVFKNQPEDFYTKVTNQDGTSTIFSVDLDFDTTLQPGEAYINPELIGAMENSTEEDEPSVLKQGAKEGQVSIIGQHFSKQQRATLSGAYYGTGIKGAEGERLRDSRDARIRRRLYFYVDEGKGVFPEYGVGNFKHIVDLPNMYDASKNPLKLPTRDEYGQRDMNKFESAVLDAGFDGYYIREAFHRQGAAVLLGDASMGVQPKNAPVLAQSSPDQTETQAFKDWAGTDDPVIESNEVNGFDFRGQGPFVMKAFHGTTNTFEVFNASIKGNKEGQFGALNYFTTSEQDAWDNYSSTGPDLTSRIETLKERLEQQFESDIEDGKDADEIASEVNAKYEIDLQALDIPRVDNDPDGEIDPYELADMVANRVLHGGDEKVLELYIRTEKPFVVEENTSPWMEFFDDAALDQEAIKRVADNNGVSVDDVESDRDTYEDEIYEARYEIMDEMENPLVAAVQTIADRYGFDPSNLMERVHEVATDGSVQHGYLEALLRESANDSYIEDPETGDLISSHVVGEIIQELGFDSIILKDANKRFKNMGMEPGTAHVHVFDANNTNIKSVTDNVGTFDPKDPSILAQNLPEGVRGTFNMETLTISLMNGSDLSTVIHESGHFYLKMLQVFANDPNAPKEVVDDYLKVLDWFGILKSTWENMTLDQQRPYHEQWAESFELWNMEGKAPTSELQPVFARFRAWLLAVYKSVEDFLKQHPAAGKLNDEIRQVFGRLLAAEDAIKVTESARAFQPLFTSGETVGAPQSVVDHYIQIGQQATEDATAQLQARSLRDMRWLSNARSRAVKDLQNKAKDQREAILKEVTTEVMSEPVNQARTFLRSGKMTDPVSGEQIEILKGYKLDSKILSEMYPKDALDRPDLGALRGMTSTDGLDPDTVAGMFGFTSGDALVRSLISEEQPEGKIEGLTDQRMLEEHGDLIDAKSMERAADEAVHNEARARFVATGLKILSKSPIGVNQLNKAAKNAAEEQIAKKKVRDLRPKQYLAAETKANKAALASVAKDPQEAARHQRVALLNNRLAMAAHDAVTEVEKALKYLGKFNSEGTRKNLDLDYLEQIDALLEPFDLRKGESLKTIDATTSLAEWVRQQEALGFEPTVDPEQAAALRQKSYKNMTMDELRGLVDTIKQIEHMGRMKKKLLTAEERADFLERINEAKASIAINANRAVEEKGTPSDVAGLLGQWFRQMTAAHRKFSSYIRELDGGAAGGVMYNLLLRGATTAANTESEMRANASDKIGKLFDALPTRFGSVLNMVARKRQIPGTDISLTDEERVMIALNWGNEGNRQRLMDGGITGRKALSAPEVGAILDTLTQEEWKFVQGVWDFIAEYKPQIEALERTLTGKTPEWIEPAPIETKFGTIPGGYFPAKYDTVLSTRSDALEAATDLRSAMRGAFGSAAARNGYTKARADAVVGRPLLLNFNAISRHVNEVIHRLAWQPWLVDANRIVKALDGDLRQTLGAEATKEMQDVMIDIARGEAPASTPVEVAINRVRTGTSIVGMGWKIMTALLQPAGLTNSFARIGGRHMAKGLSRCLANPMQADAWVNANSALMRNRGRTMNREMNEILNTVRSDKATSALTSSYFYLIGKIQRMVDVPTYIGAYEKALEDMHYEGAANAEERDRITKAAHDIAGQTVKDVQGGGELMDLAKAQRGSPIMKLFTNFYSYMNTVYNMNVEAFRTTNFKSPTEVAIFTAEMLLINIVPVIMSVALKNALTGDCAWDDVACLLGNYKSEQISHFFGQLLILREIGVSVDVATGGDAFGYSGPAGLRFFADLYKVGQQANQGDVDLPLIKAANNASGALFHYPAGALNNVFETAVAVEEGRIEGAEILPSIIAGPPRN